VLLDCPFEEPMTSLPKHWRVPLVSTCKSEANQQAASDIDFVCWKAYLVIWWSLRCVNENNWQNIWIIRKLYTTLKHKHLI